jgi:hypothetical protein
MKAFITYMFAIVSVTGTLALAQDIRQERVQFSRGETGTTIEGRISGYEIVDYKLGARAGQAMNVTMETDNDASYFNVMAPGETEVAFFIGSTQGNEFSGQLPETGDYTIRVYMMRSAARRNEIARYRIEVDIAATHSASSQAARAAPAAPAGDFADGMAGGPDFWEVHGVSSALNIRSQPSTRAQVVIRFAPGTVLRNLGCREVGGRKWCEVEQPDGGVSGWASGDYLIEAAYQPGSAAPGNDALVPGTDFHATGDIPCSMGAGQPAGSCPFGVKREGNGNGMVTVTKPDGRTRTIFFDNGAATGYDESQADPGEFSAERQSDVSIIYIGDERYEIFDAVIFGG